MSSLDQPEAFLQARNELLDADGDIGAESRDFLRRWMNAFAARVGKHAGSSAQGA